MTRHSTQRSEDWRFEGSTQLISLLLRFPSFLSFFHLNNDNRKTTKTAQHLPFRQPLEILDNVHLVQALGGLQQLSELLVGR